MASVDAESQRLLYRVAQAYYDEALTQQQIARRFGLSRPKVSRLLQRARASGVVKIVLVPPSSDMSSLERGLEARYGLDEAVVVAVTDPRDAAGVARELGPAAAECLARSIRGNEVVGITWGSTLLAMVDALPARSWPDVTIVQIMGGLGPVDAREHSADLTRRVARRFGARLELLPAPGLVSSVAAAEALRADPQIAATLRLAARADIAIVGLGVPSPDSVVMRHGTIISPAEAEAAREAGAVGDIALRFIDADGRPVRLPLNEPFGEPFAEPFGEPFGERIIGLTLDEIRAIPRTIGVAGGEAKYAVVRAALRAHLIDVLVTDHVTAQRLLDATEDNGAESRRVGHERRPER